MEDIILSLLVFAGAFVLAFFVVERLRNPVFKWMFIIAHACLLTLLTLFLGVRYPYFWTEQAAAMTLLRPVSDLLKPDRIGPVMKKTQFLMLDVTRDIALVPSRGSDEDADANGKKVITDRQKLADLLEWLGQDSIGRQIDQVVCDVQFQMPTDSITDGRLLQALNRLNNQHKLLMARSLLPDYDLAEPAWPNLFGPDLDGGLVDYTAYGGTFFNYQLMAAPDDQRPLPNGWAAVSLPYVLYQRTHHLEPPLTGIWFRERRDDGSNTAWGLSTFIPELFLTDDDVLNPESPGDSVTVLEKALIWLGNLRSDAPRLTDASQSMALLRQDVGFVTSPRGRLLTKILLKQGRQAGKRTIVWIGVFKDAERDKHMTAFGLMHGSLLLINVYLNLVIGNHHIQFEYLCFLLFAFGGISWLLVRTKIHRAAASKQDTEPDRFASEVQRTTIHYVRHATRDILNSVFIEKSHYWLLLITLTMSALLFGHVVNVMGLGIYLGAFSTSLTWLIQRSDHSAGVCA